MTGPWILTRDGAALEGEVHPTETAAFGRLLRIQSQSTDWAIRYEGYGVRHIDIASRRYFHVGWIDDGQGWNGRGSSVYVDLELTPIDHPMTSVEHTPVTDGWRLSVCGGTVGRRRDYDSCGQTVDTLEQLATYADGWSPADVESLRGIWDAWHLNDMRAACAHMDPDTLIREDNGYGGTRIACRPNVCPAGSGYTYGAAWLYAPIPAAVFLELERLASLPAGRIPEWMSR